MTRREAREILFELLFETEFRSDETVEEIYYSSVQNREIQEDAYVKNAYFTINAEREKIDAIINDHAKTGWKTNRLSNVSRSILRIAVYEMALGDEIPFKVSINEAIQLSKKYDDEKAKPFINGILNAVKDTYGKDAPER